MRLLDLTLPTPQENLALDEALLERAEAAGRPCEMLRLWEPDSPAVVVGSSSRVSAEVHGDACRERNVPILRRVSGGLSVVTGRGCLMYAVLLGYQRWPELRAIDQAHAFVLDRVAAAVNRLSAGVIRAGTSDLALAGRKFSGNSLRCKRYHLLYHGTLLYDFDLPLIGRLLAPPPRAPDYRAGRDHAAFVTNLPVSGSALRQALIEAWRADEPETDWPREQTERLAREKYASDAWNLRW
jgi:lipoate-protein ligase A